MEIELKEAARPEDLMAFVEAILSGEPNLNANLANIAALLYQYLPRINWVGFYLLEQSSGDWVLGPFAGKPACTRIAKGHGVVGRALQEGRIIVVDDVTTFEGHIACDVDSRSEVVVPIRVGDLVVAGLDVDSPNPSRFCSEDIPLLRWVSDRLGNSWLNSRWYA